MKTLIIWVWTFWFAILNHISKKNKDDIIYAYERNDFVFWYLKNFRKHPYFFEWVKLWENIEFIENCEKILPEIDLLILAIPCQTILPFLKEIKDKLKPWLTILNLAKWINNITLHTLWDDLKVLLKWTSYNYTFLSWWMIANDVVNWNIIWATLWVESEILWNTLKDYLETPIFQISLYTWIVKNIELAWALKNVFAIFTWYHEWIWMWSSSLWYFFCQYYAEYKKLFLLLGWDENIRFDIYAVWWDLIASCFWNSRNRFFWRLIWEWKDTKEVLEIMKNEKKIAEGYETLKWLYKVIKWKAEYPITNTLWKKILFPNNK